MARVKGSAICSRALWVSLNHGDEGLRRLKGAVRADTRAAIEEGARAKPNWYPFEVFVDLNETIDREFGRGDLALVKALGRYGADANLTTIYRLFFMVGTVKWIIDRAARLWDLHYDTGKLVMMRQPGERVEARILGFDTPHRTHCLSVAGWIERSVELSGGKDVRIEEPFCRARGDAECTLRISWR